MLRWWSFAPALVVVIPLIGFSLQEDDRRRIYTAAHQFGSNPLAAIRHAYRTIDGFLDKGNFRPVGRALENIERIFVFASAEATGVPPHIAQGAIRLAIVSCLAVVAMMVISAITRSAGAPFGKHPAVTLYPMILGTTLVATNPSSPITRYPLLLIGSVVFILLTALVIARDDDMEPRPLSWHEPVFMVFLGAVSAAYFDLVYAAPPIAGAFAAARHAAADRPISRLPRTAAFRRWTIYSSGFLAVFAPVRAVIAYRCSQRLCYSGSSVSLSALPGEFGELAVGRALTGLPPAGWSYTSELLRLSNREYGFTDFAANPLLVLLSAAIAVVALRTARRSIRPTRTPTAAGGKLCHPQPPEADLMDGNGGVRPSAGVEAGAGHRLVPCLRLASCLGAFGTVTVLIPSVIASLSEHTQSTLPPVGRAWRETVLVQTGWSFAIAAAVLALIGTARSPRTLRLYVGITAAIMGAGLAFTLLTNARLAYFDRTMPLSAITDEISMSVINIDYTHEGNLRRCDLIDTYTQIYPDPTTWTGGPQLRTELDELMISLHGWPFCDPDALSGLKNLEPITTVHIIQKCILKRSCVTRAQTAEFLARALELPLTPVGHRTTAAAFTDIADNPHAASIQALADAGLAQGCTNTTFCPDRIVTRAQIAAFLATALRLPLSPTESLPLPAGHPTTSAEHPTTTSAFTDIADNPHAASIQALADAGITRGCTNTTFCPDRIVTRAQVDKFLARAFGS